MFSAIHVFNFPPNIHTLTVCRVYFTITIIVHQTQILVQKNYSISFSVFPPHDSRSIRGTLADHCSISRRCHGSKPWIFCLNYFISLFLRSVFLCGRSINIYFYSKRNVIFMHLHLIFAVFLSSSRSDVSIFNEFFCSLIAIRTHTPFVIHIYSSRNRRETVLSKIN